jgi:dynein regulatory complex protein 1
VTNIRTGVIARESLLRHDQAKMNEVWSQREMEERNASVVAGEVITKEWNVVDRYKGPYEMQELLQKQKKACSELIQIKNSLIGDYINELKSKDDEYVRELKRQAEEIDKLLDRMEAQYKSYQTSLIEEIEQIERAFVEERTELISANLKEVEKLFESRRFNEQKYMEDRSNRIDDYLKQLELLRVNDSEEYNLVKIKLETDVQVLEQQLQQVISTY